MSLVLVDGVETDTIVVTDSTVLRGDGCFEAVRSYGGSLFALDEHLDRLALSAASLRIDLPERAVLERWCRRVAAATGDGVVRLVMSRGDAIPGPKASPRCIVLGHAISPTPSPFWLEPVEVPWHAAGIDWILAGAKTVSYAPNLAASRDAVERGGHDALMISTDGWVLEGPTFAVGWVVDGVLHTPSLDLSILDSITRRHVLRIARRSGIEVFEGRFELSQLDAASEVMAWSTVKEVAPVHRVGRREFSSGPLTAQLSELFRGEVEAATR